MDIKNKNKQSVDLWEVSWAALKVVSHSDLL
jgi:hypothetical protein